MLEVCEKLDLHLDKMYKDREGMIVLIMGEILPDTLEYQKGLRFFDGTGVMYRPDGTCFHPIYAPCELVAEASAQEVLQCIAPSEIIDLDMAASSPELFIPTTDVRFRKSLLGRYINRMGFVVTKGLDRFNPMGQRHAPHTSMKDILYQIYR